MRCGDEACLSAGFAAINSTGQQGERDDGDWECSTEMLSGNVAPCCDALQGAGFLALMLLASETPSASSPPGLLREKGTLMEVTT